MDRCFRTEWLLIGQRKINFVICALKQCGSIKYDIIYLLYIDGFLLIEACVCEKREIMLTSVLVFT